MQAPDRDKRAKGGTELSRRGFAVTTLGMGFAAAVQPSADAATITTDTQGLTAGEVQVPVSDGSIPAYRAMPASGGPFPTILVVQEIFGVHEHIKDICRRFAKLGYFAVAPALFAREGDVSRMTDVKKIVAEVAAKVPDAQAMSDLDATVAWADGSGKADTGRLGITGFCWGGRIVWLYAAHNDHLKAAVAWYGPLASGGTELQPKSPIDLAAAMKAPVLGLYGGADANITAEHIARMKDALTKAGKTAEFVVYPNAPHAFNADYRPSYREGPARDGWQRCLSWFKTHGVA